MSCHGKSGAQASGSIREAEDVISRNRAIQQLETWKTGWSNAN